MRVRCLHCHEPIEVPDEGDLSKVHCPVCGGSFSLVGESTVTHAGAQVRTLGHFELIEQIGLGAFGTVWKARDTQLDRIVAVKVPRAGKLGADEAEMFLREARAAAQLKHPNIVPVHEVGRADETIYIVSDLVQGATLDEWLTGRRLSPREAAELCLQIAEALDHAHQSGVIHRDLKPGNIMLDMSGRPYLLDFGLARRPGREATMTVDGRVLGTPAYMSPEQARGEGHTADPRTDIYSLGVVLFRLLTGELPFRGNAQMLVVQILQEEPPSPRKLNGHVPRDLETICLKCLEKEPAKRYQSAKELAEELRHYLAGEPIAARPITRLARGWRWSKRKPMVAGLSAAVLGLLLTIAIAAPLAAWRESQLRQEAQEVSFQLTLDKAWDLPEQGQVAEGMLRLADCLERAPADARELRQAIRANLAAWCRQLHPLKSVLVHPSEVNAAAVSPDGSWLVTGGNDGTVLVWDLRTGQQISRLARHEKAISAVAVSSKGKMIVTASLDGTARLWDATTWQAVGQPLKHSAPVTSAAISPDVPLLLTGSQDGKAALWDLETQQVIGVPLGHKSAVDAVAFVPPDGKRFLTHDHDHLRIWDTATRAPVEEAQWEPKAKTVFSLACSPDGLWFLAGGQDQTVRRQDAATGESVGVPMEHPEPVHAVAVNSRGTEVLTGSRDGVAQRWNVETGQPLGCPMRHALRITSVAFANGDSCAITAGMDKTVRVWQVPELGRRGPFGHKGMVRGVAFSPDGTCALTASSDGTVQEYGVATGEPLSTPLEHPDGAMVAAYSPDGTRIVTGAGRIVRQWDRTSHEPIGPALKHRTYGVVDVTYSPDGSRILSANGLEVVVWNALDGVMIHRFPKTFPCAVFNRDGSKILTSGWCDPEVPVSREDQTARLWDARTFKLLMSTPPESSRVWAIGFSPDGKRFLTGTFGGVLQVWDTATAEPIGPAMRAHKSSIRRAVFSPDGRRIVTASHDRTARVWDVATGRTIGPPMKHSGPVKAVAVSPDGKLILTGDGDGGAWIWDAPPPALNGDVERIKLWVEIVTGMELGEEGQAQVLDAREWHARRKRLEELGGSVLSDDG